MELLCRSIGALVLGLAITVGAAQAGENNATTTAVEQLEAQFPQAKVSQRSGRNMRVYGQPLAFGDAPQVSAEAFRAQHAAVFGVEPNDLVPDLRRDGDQTIQPVMYRPDTGDYKFYLASYTQQKSGVPVYGAGLRLLMRNEPGYPVVLAAADLRNIGDFAVAVGATAPGPGDTGHTQAVVAAADLEDHDYAGRRLDIPGPVNFNPSKYVIWAGVGDEVETPVLAVTFLADNGLSGTSSIGRWRFVADAVTGRILHTENLIHLEDVTGNVSAMASEGPKSDDCSEEVLTPMPYAKAEISGVGTAYADVDGNFVIANGGTSQVSVTSSMSGQYFVVNNTQGAEETLTQVVTPPGPANFMHNAFNTSDHVRAQVNGYIQSNIVRDLCLTYNPSFPVVATDIEFPVNVNVSPGGICPGNAWYDDVGGSINFCAAGQQFPNFAFSNIVHHEYGHHMVHSGGGSNGAYHEGMSDSIAMMISDDPIMGYGALGDCNSGGRTADNNFQYPCSGGSHTCGQLLSGCIWSTRMELIVTEPADYLSILSNLTVNSILMIGGGGITPDITIDFLTLDDDDGSIGNGTPHYNEICAGFGDHNMDCPPLSVGLDVGPTSHFESEGQAGGPFTPASKDFTLANLYATPIDYEVTVTQSWLDVTNASGTIPGNANVVVTASINASANSLPEGAYGDTLSFVNLTDHVGDTTRAANLTIGVPIMAYEWPLDAEPVGWTTAGQWEFGTVTGQGGNANGNADPSAGHTGVNVYGVNNAGDYSTTPGGPWYLATEPIDLGNYYDTSVRFWRWLNTDFAPYAEATVEVSANGSNWTTVWQNGANEIADSSWAQFEYDISAVADQQSSVRIRWGYQIGSGAWQYSGWNVDDIQIFGRPTSVCGDGNVEPGEDCDDGNQTNGDGCDDDTAGGGNCTPTGCGNGVVTAGEECDDGNAEECDGCNSACTAGPCAPARPLPHDEGFGSPCSADGDCTNEAYCVPDAAGTYPGTCCVPKNRYLTVSVNAENVDPTARRIRLDDGTADGLPLGWAGHPDGNGVSRVEATPHYMVWPEPCSISDCEIAPGDGTDARVYWIDAIAEGDDVGDPARYSAVLALRTTQRWGDVSDSSSGPPNGDANFADISRVVQGFQGAASMPDAWLDLGPELTNSDINFGDINACVQGFQGQPYPFASPDACP